MTGSEFYSLIAGFNETTAIIKIAQIRAEDDSERLKYFTPEMKKIRNDWITKTISQRTEEEDKRVYDELRSLLSSK